MGFTASIYLPQVNVKRPAENISVHELVLSDLVIVLSSLMCELRRWAARIEAMCMRCRRKNDSKYYPGTLHKKSLS